MNYEVNLIEREKKRERGPALGPVAECDNRNAAGSMNGEWQIRVAAERQVRQTPGLGSQGFSGTTANVAGFGFWVGGLADARWSLRGELNLGALLAC